MVDVRESAVPAPNVPLEGKKEDRNNGRILYISASIISTNTSTWTVHLDICQNM